MFNWHMLYFQDPSCFTNEMIIYFHDFSMMILLLVTSLILYIMLILSINKFTDMLIVNSQFLEIIWTILPMLILFFLAIPSLRVLYIMEENYTPSLTIKCMGHQWYWSYEYSDFNCINFDSFMNKSLNLSTFRLLDVDNNLILPFNYSIRMIISSEDVIHSWTMPSFGLKMDAVPGRLNQMYLLISRPGLFYGQCSEICGVNHSFMPICIESTNFKTFIKWVDTLSNM